MEIISPLFMLSGLIVLIMNECFINLGGIEVSLSPTLLSLSQNRQTRMPHIFKVEVILIMLQLMSSAGYS